MTTLPTKSRLGSLFSLSDSLGGEGGSWKSEVLSVLAPSRARIALSAVLLSVLSFAPVLLARAIYDVAIPERSSERLGFFVVGIALLGVWSLALHVAQAGLVERLAAAIDEVVSSRLIRAVLGARYDARQGSSAAAEGLAHLESVRDLASANNFSAVVSLAFVPLYLLGCFVYGGPIGFLVLGASVVLGLGLLVLQSAMRVPAERSALARQESAALISEAASALETIKLTRSERVFAERFDVLSRRRSEATFSLRRLSAVAVGVGRHGSSLLVSALVLGWSAFRMLDGRMEMGDMIAVSMLAGQAVGPLTQVPALLVRFAGASNAFRSLDSILSAPREDEGRSFARIDDLSAVAGGVELKSVRFSHPSPDGDARGSVPALVDVELSIAPGEKVGIVGPSGSGKSTLLRLLAGLHRADEGRVLIDGIDVSHLRPFDLRGIVGLHAQQSPLARGTLRDNLLLGRPEAPFDEVLRVAEAFGVAAMARSHPLNLGLDLPVAEGGRNFSGGQRQLIALARTMLASPRIALFDEPTSELDSEAEEAVKRSLASMLDGRTAVIVSHRLSILSLCDRIVSMEGGRIVRADLTPSDLFRSSRSPAARAA